MMYDYKLHLVTRPHGLACGSSQYVTKDDTNIVVSSKVQVAGKTISFSIGAPEGKVTDTVKIKNEDGIDVSALVSLDHADNYGTFVMPAYNVKIEVTYKDLDTTSYHVVANYDDEEFSVYDQSSSWTDLDNGVSVELSGNLNLYIEAYEATEFYYSIKMGNTLVVDKVKVEGDEETGEPAHIFKQIILTGDVQIKVGKTAAEAEIAVAPTSNKVTVTALFDSEEYSISTSSDFDQRFTAPFQVDKGTRYFITVQDDDGLIFYVSFKKASDAKATVYPASEDEDTGEYTFSMAYTFEEDTVIKVGESEASVL